MSRKRWTPVPVPVALEIAEAKRLTPQAITWAVQESITTADPEGDVAEVDTPGDDHALRAYWTRGKGAAKIRWGTSGDFDRCVRHLGKYVADPKGLCAEYHHTATGMWPGRKNKHAADGAPVSTGHVAVREASIGGAKGTRPGRMLCRLIKAGVSLNGNAYPAGVLQEAARRRAWASGSPCFVDHATDAEEEARPSGSIRNLAGVLAEDARWDEESQSLVAEVRLFEPWRATLTDMAEHIGMSIRAWVTGGHGTYEGRDAFVVERIEAGRSVDFVTVPAAGGGIVSILEAVGNTVPVAEARNCGHWFEARIHAGFTEIADRMFGDGYLTRDERITLSGAIGDALDAFSTRLGVDAPHLYERDPYAAPDALPTPEPAAEAAPDTTPGTAVEAVSTSDQHNPDGTPPDGSTTPTIEEEPAMTGPLTGSPPAQAGTATVPDGGQTPPNPTVPPNDPAPQPASPAPPQPDVPAQESATLAALRAVTEQLATVQSALAAVTARDAARESEARTLRNEATARQAVVAAVDGPEVPAQWRAHITPRVTAAVLASIPVGEGGVVDAAALNEAITAAIGAELTHARTIQAQALEEAGVGLPAGLGATREQVEDDGLDTELKALFEGSLGLNSRAADIAVKGRG